MPNGMYGGVGGRVGKQSLRSYPIPPPPARATARSMNKKAAARPLAADKARRCEAPAAVRFGGEAEAELPCARL